MRLVPEGSIMFLVSKCCPGEAHQRGGVPWPRIRHRTTTALTKTTPRQDADVLLDVSELEVDRINLEVNGLKAHVSVLAELAAWRRAARSTRC